MTCSPQTESVCVGVGMYGLCQTPPRATCGDQLGPLLALHGEEAKMACSVLRSTSLVPLKTP